MFDPAEDSHEASPRSATPPSTADRAAATRREHTGPTPAPTRRESPGAAPSAVLAPGALPDTLRDRLSGFAVMPTQGSEANLLRVRDSVHPDAERVLKIYRPQLVPSAEVWSELTSVRSPHVVDIVETGQLTDGRFYELMEYLPEGNLRGLGAGREVFTPVQITEVVRQLCAGLAALHEHGITHRDLKPENVLIRSADRMRLVLTDFGLSRRLDRSMVFSTDARTSAYAAPEAYSKHVSPARDWWSLGIMLHELATGVRPFQDLDELMIQKAVTTRPVSVDAITDARLNRLCAGLLVADDAKRWGRKEVEAWLNGDLPPIPDRRVPLEVRAFAFGDAYYSDPESLAAAMAEHWAAAAGEFFVALGESWESLKIWLRQFDDPARYPASVVAQRHRLLDNLQLSTAAPDTKLLQLLAGLNPALPPIYRQTPITVARLRALAATASGGGPGNEHTRTARNTIADLWNDRLLSLLAQFADSGELAAVDERWRHTMGTWESAVAVLHRQPRLAAVLSTPETTATALAGTLELAIGVARGADWLRALDERGRALPAPVVWYDELRTWVGDEPVRALAAWCASGVAQAEAEQELRTRQAAEQAARQREQAWSRREERRLAGRAGATAIALSGVVIVLFGALVIGLVSAATATSVALVTYLCIALATELGLASTLGAQYHPRYSLYQAICAAAGRIGEHMRYSPGRWVLGIIALLFVLGFLDDLVTVLVVAAAIGQLVWAWWRFQQWSHMHDQDRREGLSE